MILLYNYFLNRHS